MVWDIYGNYEGVQINKFYGLIDNPDTTYIGSLYDTLERKFTILSMKNGDSISIIEDVGDTIGPFQYVLPVIEMNSDSIVFGAITGYNRQNYNTFTFKVKNDGLYLKRYLYYKAGGVGPPYPYWRDCFEAIREE
jgi:hypothetical protein